jgi:hypothetical protein
MSDASDRPFFSRMSVYRTEAVEQNDQSSKESPFDKVIPKEPENE